MGKLVQLTPVVVDNVCGDASIDSHFSLNSADNILLMAVLLILMNGL